MNDVPVDRHIRIFQYFFKGAMPRVATAHAKAFFQLYNDVRTIPFFVFAALYSTEPLWVYYGRYTYTYS